LKKPFCIWTGLNPTNLLGHGFVKCCSTLAKRVNILIFILNVLYKVRDFITSQAFAHFTFTWVQIGEVLEGGAFLDNHTLFLVLGNV
jgi:hypothetical protein